MSRFRRLDRYVVGSHGRAMSLDGHQLIGDRVLDASGEGVLVACDERVELGQRVFVSYPVPRSELVFDAETEVVRIVRGEREGDPGYCAGLRFVAFDRRDRLALGIDLRELPLVPRRVRWDATRATPIPLTHVKRAVVVRPIMQVGA
ncbi:PilZ domain-containing protein [Sandaracinus amylolyticus]|uniref:PilZ domain-containing protein n=1 Tax=Sandaracinus amylolyticus TaxID=927083 RepID=A0A0F6W1Z3_9BACT|nr:PilZ domain-containing protein [Sandaracinus amylolyticus]AKF05380.1 hypothetical protein DB32_002529 [Sandaracinus amylolyticus]